MPRHVDHEQRRAQVVAVATDLVVVEGRDALTVRNVARASGCSTKVVSHYFADVTELHHATYAAAAGRASARVQAVLDADSGDVAGLLGALLPVDAERARDWTIWLSFWSEALPSERLRADQAERSRSIDERLARALGVLVERGELAPDVDVDVAGCRLGAILHGVAIQATFDPERWPPGRQRDVVDSELALLGIRSPAAR